MSEAAEFEVEDPGAPTLQGGEAGGAEAGPEVGPDVGIPNAVALLAWTPTEVTAAICQWWNLGCLWFGPEWQAHPTELAQLSVMLAPYFDIWFPKGGGQDPGLVMVALAAAGTGITMALSRAPAVQRHWRRPWMAEQVARARAQQPPAAGPRAEASASAAGGAGAGGAGADAPSGPGGSSFHLPRDLVAVVKPPPGDALVGIGL